MTHSLIARVAATALILALPGATWAVGSTPVTVVNPENNAVPVRDAGQPQPVSGACGLTPSTDNHCDLYTVPAGKRLVVELFSYLLAAPTNGGKDPYLVVLGNPAFLNCFGCSDVYFFPPGIAYPGDFTITLWSDTRTVRIYLNENQTLSAKVVTNGITTNNHGQMFTFSGFLVNK